MPMHSLQTCSFRIWELFLDMLSRFIDAEYADPSDEYMLTVLKMIGIEKVKPFHPDPATEESAENCIQVTR